MRPPQGVLAAEGEGFEPPVGETPTAVFKTAALSHSAIPPGKATVKRIVFRFLEHYVYP